MSVVDRRAGSALIVAGSAAAAATATTIGAVTVTATATGWPTFYLHASTVDGPFLMPSRSQRVRICLCASAAAYRLRLQLPLHCRPPVDHHIAFTLRNHVNCVD